MFGSCRACCFSARVTSDDTQATTSIANFVRNLITPGVYRILCPSALESLALGSGSATAPSRSVLRILRGATPTEQAHLIWTPAMRERLLSRLSIVRLLCYDEVTHDYFL